MRNVVFASMRTYARRYLAALVAVIIATGFIVAINALSAAAREGANEVIAQHYRGVDVAASEAEDPGQYEKLLIRAKDNPAVTASAINWSGWLDATLPLGTKTVSLGSVATDPALRWQRVSSGRLPIADGEVAFSKARAKKEKVHVGDSIRTEAGDRKLTVTGLVDDADGPLKSVLYLPEAAAAELGDMGQAVDAVFAVRGDPAAVARSLDLPGIKVMTAAAHEKDLRLQATQGIDIFQKLILVFAGISLFVGALVIANTFTILLAQRARDLALLRCVGALRGQIARSVVTEGLVIGAVGSAVGVGLGFLIANVGVTAIHTSSPTTPMSSPTLSAGIIAVPVLLGIAVTVAASYVPARRAGAQSPLAALQPQDIVEVRTKAGATRIAMAFMLLLAGVGGLVLGTGGSLPMGLLGGMLSFIGILLMTPLLVPTAIRAFGPLVRLGGVSAKLAHSNSLRNPRRTAATSTALLIGVTLITSVVVGASSISNKVNTSLDGNHPIDLIATSSAGALPRGTSDELGAVGGVASAVEVRGTKAQIAKSEVTVLGVDDKALSLVHGNRWLHRLKADHIVLPAASEDYPSLEAGDTVTLDVGGRTRELTVAFGSGLGDAPIVRSSTLDAMGAKTVPQEVWIKASDGSNAGDVMSDVSAITQRSDLDLAGGLPERADILRILDIVLAITVGLLAIAVLIALVGVGNTLSLSVLERVRENSLLRALGLERSGLRAMLAVEALLMSGVSAVLGIALGSAYAWFGVKTVSGGIFKTAPDLTVPWTQVGLIFVVAAAAGLLACVLPARQAARIAPAAGLVAD